MITKKIVVNGIEISYFDTSTLGKPLILIHGLSLKEGFTNLLEEKQPELRLIAPELPGMGNSVGNGFDYSYDNIVDYIYTFVEKLGLKKVSVFGNSLGGTLAILFAYKHPQMVDKLIIRSPLYTNTQLPWYFSNRLIINFYEKVSSFRSIRFIFKGIFNYIFGLISSKEHSPEKKTKAIQKLQNENVEYEAIRQVLLQVARTDIIDILPKLSLQTLIIWPKKDELLKVEYAYKVNTLIKNSTLYIEDHTYHNILSENNKNFLEEVSKFINDY